MTTSDRPLLARGWTSGAGDADLREWLSPDGDAVLVPHRKEFADFGKILSHTKSALVNLLDVTREFLDTVILLPVADVVDVHAFPSIEQPAYAFDAVLKLLASTRASFKLATRSLSKPAMSYGGGSAGTDAADYLRDLRIGFSQPGSYSSFPVFAPLGLEKSVAQTDQLEGQESFPDSIVETYERRVTLRMLDSVREANELAGAAVAGGLEVFDIAYEKGVPANLCEAVDHMFVDGYFSAIELRPRLSTEVVSSVRPMVRIDSASVPVFRDAAVRLRKLSKQPEATTVTGRVTDLHRSSPATDESVSVTSLFEGKKRTIRM